MITIEIKKSDLYTLEDKAAFVSFRYDEELVNLMRSIPIRYYHKDIKEWEVPVDKIDYIKQQTSGIPVKINGEQHKKENTLNYIPDTFSFVTQPFSHQIDGVNFGLCHNNWILSDEQGLGKTKQIIDLAVIKKQTNNYKHCLIICGVNGLKYNWQNEIETHSNEESWILGSRLVGNALKVKGTKEKIEDLYNIDKIDSYFIITNIESLRNQEVVTELKKLCQQKTINMISVDEIHKCCNPTAQQSKGLLQLDAECKIALTGTPLMNTPLDLYLPLKWLGYENHAFYSFKHHYIIYGGFGGYEIVGYKNLDELQEKLSKIMLRRKKEDVLDLPDKIYTNDYIELSEKQQKLYNDVLSMIRADIDKIKLSPDPLAQLLRLRQVTGCPSVLSSNISDNVKLDRLEQLIDDAVQNDEKVVIFSNWVHCTDVIYDRLNKKYTGLVITGNTDVHERQSNINKFQNDKKYKYILGTIGALGIGVTLTAGTVIVFYDEPWTMAAYEQAVDRCHRIGTKSNITIYNLIAKNTIDERIHEIVQKKGLLSDVIVDGRFDTGKEQILDYLLS